MADFRTELVKAAQAELIRFDGRDETNPGVRDILIEYWTKGGGRTVAGAKTEIRKRTAWSAAFISFCVKNALAASGSRAKFTFSASHSVYIGASILNVLNNKPAPAFYGQPPTGAGAVAPEVGNIIGVTRTRHIDDYADALDAARSEDTYFSHCDIVTAKAGGKIKRIGGNVSNSVTEKTLNLTSAGLLPVLPFKFDSAGQVLSGPFICVIKQKDS
jgi:hypothetical protein